MELTDPKMEAMQFLRTKKEWLFLNSFEIINYKTYVIDITKCIF
jgi:hypothetical protein